MLSINYSLFTNKCHRFPTFRAMAILRLVCVLVAVFVSSTSACSSQDTKWVNHTARILNVESSDTSLKHAVGGTVQITSGCTFSVRNMTLIPSGNAVYWWGIPVSNNTEPYPRVVTSALGSFNGQPITFTLDSQYSFDDIAIMEMRSEADNRAYGAWAISGNVTAYYGINNKPNLGVNPEDIASSASPLVPVFWMHGLIMLITLIIFIS